MSSIRTRFRLRRPLRLTALEARLAPATFTVTNDTNTGVGSLRQAVLDANTAAGADLIDFSSYFNVPRTITLASQISITGAVTIDGTSAANVTISGNNAVGIFNTVSAPAGAAIGFVDLTLTKGYAFDGGAVIAGDEALTATRCVLTGNYAYSRGGAIYVGVGGALSATDCAFTSNTGNNGGGAIWVDGGAGTNTVLTRCEISGNSAHGGGGLNISSSLVVDASTVSGNVATGYWGYYSYYASNGGGMNVYGTTTIRNSTVSGNGATGSGGGIQSSSTLTVLNSTIMGNGAGSWPVFGSGGGIQGVTITIESSIVANNGASYDPDISAFTVNAKTSSIRDHSGITTFNDQGGNRPAGEDPRISPLQNNGGPTKTRLLLPNSPCLNAGSNPASLTTDQRGPGFPRVLAGTADMGAAEGADVNPLATLISLPPTITAPGGTNYDVVVRYEDDLGIDLATVDLNDITVSGPGYAAPQAATARSIVGSGTVVTVTYTLPAPGGTFDFADAGLYTIALTGNQIGDTDTPAQHFVAAGLLGSFRVAIKGAVAVDELSDIDDGNTSKGHVSLREALRLTNAAIGTSDTITFDPAVFSAPLTLKLTAGEFAITDSLIISAPAAGLTLDADGKSRVFNINVSSTGVVSLSGLTLINGVASFGGGVTVNGSLTATDCVFTSNMAGGQGGAIFVAGQGATTTLIRSTVAGNSAYAGGGMSISGGLFLDSSTVSGNIATGYNGYYGYYPGYGGGIAANGISPGTLTVRNSTISGNRAGLGGGINVTSGNLLVQNSTITGNSATWSSGGGISGLVVVLESSIVASNVAVASGPEINATTAIVKNSSIVNRNGITTFDNQGGNRPAGEDPLLGPLQNNGGPTLTHALLVGSPAVQRGSNPAGDANDQRGPGFSRVVGLRADMGAFESSDTRPVSTLISLPPTVTAAGGTSYEVVVLYEDETGIDLTTIDVSDLTVTGPGYAAPQAPTARSINGSGKSVTVTYTISAPGGAFDLIDDGVYTVSVAANQVGDTDTPGPNFVAPDKLGTFSVAIPFALVVDEASDIDDGNTTKGKLSLREAVRLTNEIVGSSDTITFDPGTFNSPMTLKLSAGAFVASDPLVIIGPGAGLLTLDAAGKSRVFTMNPGTGNSVSLSGVTLTNGVGDYGGAIYASGGLTLSNVVVSNCKALSYYSAAGGGVYVSGALTATNCSFMGNTVSLVNSYYGPLSSFGGAMRVSGDLLLEACTVSGNVAVGGYYYNGYYAYYSPGIGGGISANGSVTIRNSTISGNGAGYGGGIAAGILLVQNGTITDNSAKFNGGGISGSAISVESSIVGKNVASFGSDIVASSVSAKNSSIFSQNGITTFNNLGGNRPAGEDPLLGPLTNNGGPTKTHRLLPGSPCIDVGSNPANLITDQRGSGFPRVLNGSADIGAVEDVSPLAAILSLPPTITVAGGTSFSVTVRYEDGTGIDLATIDVSDIYVTGPGYFAAQAPTAFSVAGSGKSVTVTYTLTAPGGAFDFIDYGLYTVAVAAHQIGDTDTPVQFFIAAGPLGTFRVEIAGTLVVDEASDIDDGVTSFGHLSLREALRLTNTAAGTSDTITFDPAAFSSPVTLKLTAGEFAVTDPLVLIGPGAGVLTLDAAGTSRLFNINLPGTVNLVSLSGLTMINGLANSGNGGAIITTGGLTLSGIVISNCQTVGGGGGVFVSNGPLTVRDSTVSNNKSTGGVGGGGGIVVSSGAVVIERSSIVNNQTSYIGGGLFLPLYGGRTLQISDSTIANNSAQNGGGGIFLLVGAPGSFIRNSTISGNSAVNGYGGGIAMNYYSGTLPIANCTITGNSTTGPGGGGIGAISGKISLNSTIVAGNLASTGADMYFNTTTSIPGDNNLVGVKNSGNFNLSGSGNKTGTQSSPLDAKLGPLAYNGGPTKTHVLLSGSPAIDKGNNVVSLVNDQRGAGFGRVFNSKADIGAFEVQPVPPPCVVGQTVIINGGAAQRSRVTILHVDFDQLVTLPANAADAFQLKRQADSALVGLTATVATDSATHVTLTFTGAVSNFGSLQDGRYTLTVLASKVSNANGNLDGDCNGAGGDNYVLAGTPANGLFRLFGDSTGDGTVAASDFTQFRLSFGGSNTAFDFDNDGAVAASDFTQFRLRFGGSI